MTSKLTKIDRAACRDLRAAIEVALKSINDQFGVVCSLEGGSFSPETFKMKLVVSVPTASGKPADFEREARYLDLPADCYGKLVTMGRTQYEIVGLKSSRPKYPLEAKRVPDGAAFKLGLTDSIRAQLASSLPKVAAPSNGVGAGSLVTFPGFRSPVTGIVDRMNGEYATVLTPTGKANVKVANLTLVKGKRSDTEILKDIDTCYCGLSPESLTCDGEASRTHIREQGAALRACLANLFREYGREVSENEAFEATKNSRGF